MTPTMPPREWLRFTADEYLDRFIHEGGAAVKFVVPMDDESGAAPIAFARLAAERGYLVAALDASETPLHLAQEVFFRVSEAVPWQAVIDRAILRLAKERGFKTPSPGSEPVVDQLVEMNGIDRDYLTQELRPLLVDFIYRNRSLSRDFRVAMLQLCVGNLTSHRGGDRTQATIMNWLTGANKTVSPVKAYGILSAIKRANARYHFESMARFLRFVGYPGLCVTMDATRLSVARDPRDELVFYGRAALLDCYESWRQFIDQVDRLDGFFLLISPSQGFLDEDPTHRGMAAYQALQFRIYDEVRDARLVNPMASLIRLAADTSMVSVNKSRTGPTATSGHLSDNDRERP